MPKLPTCCLMLALVPTTFLAAEARAITTTTIARDYPADGSWKELILRGDAAEFLFMSLSEAPESTQTRHDGTTFIVRSSPAMGCARSDRFVTPHFACVGYVRADGTIASGILDPEFGTVARIGVGN